LKKIAGGAKLQAKSSLEELVMKGIFLLAMAVIFPAELMAAGTAIEPKNSPATPSVEVAKQSPPEVSAPQAVIAYVGSIKGEALIQAKGSKAWVSAKVGQRIPPGALLQTLVGSSCVVAFSEGSRVRLGSRAYFQTEELGPSNIAVYGRLGKLEVWVKKLAKRRFRVRHPAGVASVAGTYFVVHVLDEAKVLINVFQGSLFVADEFGKMFTVSQGYGVRVTTQLGLMGKPEPLPSQEIQVLEPPDVVPPPEPEKMEAQLAPSEEVPTEEASVLQPFIQTQPTQSLSPSSP
jgi:hypothetical protein